MDYDQFDVEVEKRQTKKPFLKICSSSVFYCLCAASGFALLYKILQNDQDVEANLSRVLAIVLILPVMFPFFRIYRFLLQPFARKLSKEREDDVISEI